MRSNREDAIIELDLLLPAYTNHLNFVRSFFTQIDSITHLFVQEGNLIQKEHFVNYRKQLEVSGLLTICTLDMVVSCKNLLRVKEIWEEIYYLRHGYLTIYETIQKIDIHGKWLNISADQNLELLDELQFAQRLLKQYKNKYGYHKYMPNLRNKVTAHIDGDFIAYFQEISAFDIEKGIKALIDFIQVVHAIQKYLINLSRESFSILEKEATEIDFYIMQQLNEVLQQFNLNHDKLKAGLSS
jgi:hypothetical protein